MFFIITAGFKAYSQDTIKYSYDNAGNRISRIILQLKSGHINDPNLTEKKEGEIFKDESFNHQVIKIYPNPTKGILEIEIPEYADDPSVIQITVMDINGRKIIEKMQEPFKTSVDLGSQPNGLYFLYFKKGKSVSQWKVIKQ